MGREEVLLVLTWRWFETELLLRGMVSSRALDRLLENTLR